MSLVCWRERDSWLESVKAREGTKEIMGMGDKGVARHFTVL